MIKLFDLLFSFASKSFSFGGGSGGNSNVKYDNLEKLYGTQAQAAEFMLDQAMPRLPGTLNNSQGMVDEAMSGKLGTRMRNQAATDATASFSSNMAGMNRNLSRFGSEFNPNALRQQQSTNAVLGAASRTGAMNDATRWAEDQKWNRNAGLYGQVTGTSSGAMQGMSSAGAGLGSLYGRQDATSMANAQGYGTAGASLGYGLMKARGGMVKPIKMADGGAAWEAYKKANPVMTAKRSGSPVDGAKAFVAGVAPAVVGRGLREVMPSKREVMDFAKGQWNAATAPAAADFAVPTSTDFGSALDNAPSGLDTLGSSVNSSTEAFGDTAAKVSSEVPSWLGYAKGGDVKKVGLRLASGGMPSLAGMGKAKLNLAMPTVAAMDNKPIQLPKESTIVQQAPGQQSPVGLGDAIRGAQQGDKMVDAAAAAEKAKAAGDAAEGVDAASKAADATPYGSIIKAGVDLASGRNPGEAVADAALGYGGAQAGAAIGSAAGPVGTVIGGLLGGLAGGSFFAEGGDVQTQGLRAGRQDFLPGGEVAGPGTKTSDDIPAWLSDGEIVENADTVKMPKAKTKQVIAEWDAKGGNTKDLLLALNDEGLEARDGSGEPDQDADDVGLRRACGGTVKKHGVKMAGGGYLGVALGAAANEVARQRELERADKAEDRQAKTFEQQQKEWGRQEEVDAATSEALKEQDPKLRLAKLLAADKRKAAENAVVGEGLRQKDTQIGLTRQQIEGTLKHYGDLVTQHGLDRDSKVSEGALDRAAAIQRARIQAASMHQLNPLQKMQLEELKRQQAAGEDAANLMTAKSTYESTPITSSFTKEDRDVGLRAVNNALAGLRLKGLEGKDAKAAAGPAKISSELNKAIMEYNGGDKGYSLGDVLGAGNRADRTKRASDLQDQYYFETGKRLGLGKDGKFVLPGDGGSASDAALGIISAGSGAAPAQPEAAPEAPQGLRAAKVNPKNGKTVLTYDEYADLRKRVNAMSGNGNGATSPDYWALKDKLDKSEYALY